MIHERSFFQYCFLFLSIWAVLIFSFFPAWGQQASPVIVKEVKVDRFVDRVEALGTLRANESVDLTSAITDTVTAIHFEDGQRVKAGDILVEMTNEEEHAQLEEERSTINEAKKQYERVKPLVERGRRPDHYLMSDEGSTIPPGHVFRQ